jgi:hypothetical protein
MKSAVTPTIGESCMLLMEMYFRLERFFVRVVGLLDTDSMLSFALQTLVVHTSLCSDMAGVLSDDV